MKAQFGIGHIVAMKEYTDCFGVVHPRIEGLKVERIHFVANTTPDHDPQFKPYFRILASKPGNQHEGAERFFELTQ